MNSELDDYIKLVIQPLENYKNMLIDKQHLSDSDPLILLISTQEKYYHMR